MPKLSCGENRHLVDVASWHKCEVPRCPLYRRYRGKSGSDSDIIKLTRLTQTQTSSRPSNIPIRAVKMPPDLWERA